jgi:hypothetical protein
MRRGWLVLALAVGCGSGSAGPPPQPGPRASLDTGGDPSLATATNGAEGAPEDAPLVATKGGVVQVDGADAGRVAPKAKRVDALVQILRGKKAGRAAFSFEQDARYATAKTVLASAASAGCSHAALVVRLHAHETLVRGWLEVELGPPPKDDVPERELRVKVASRGAVISRWYEGAKPIGEPIAGEALAAKLGPIIDRSWNEVGKHRDANDVRFDRAVIETEDDAPYGLLVATIDALRTPKRQAKTGTVAALRVYIPVE